MHVQSFIEHTMLHNAIAFLRCHRAGAQRMPRRLTVPLHPLLDMGDVLSGVGQLVPDLRVVAVQHVRLRRLARLHRHGPRSVLDASRDVVGTRVRFGSQEVHVLGPSRRVEGVVWMHAGHFAGICVHAAGRFT